MDEIIIDRIKVFAYHGVFEEEKRNGQNFYISIRMSPENLADSDELSDTVNYAEAADIAYTAATNRTYDLIESLANAIAKEILLRFDNVKETEVRIDKPDAPIPLEFDSAAVVVRKKRHVAYIALGSNMGDREGYLDMAVSEMKNNGNVCVKAVSSYHETEPYGVKDQEKFLNAAVKIETLLTPYELLEFAHAIEKKANRVKTRRWGERTLDVDILTYDDGIIDTKDLQIPHLEMHMRSFVLNPLSEIGAGYVHPVLRKTVYMLKKELDRK